MVTAPRWRSRVVGAAPAGSRHHRSGRSHECRVRHASCGGRLRPGRRTGRRQREGTMRVELTDAELARLRNVLGAAAGLFFDDNRRASLGHGIERRLAATGIASVARYVETVEAGAGGVERQALVDEVTIQETHFFRNPPQVRALREHVLPMLLRDAATSRRLRIWSAGCSTGEEPYTIAMLLLELLGASDAGAGWDIRVVGTDISNRALATARSGRYGERAVAFVEPATLARWFTRDGPQYVVRPQVRDLVELRHHNLAAEPTPFLAGEAVDLISAET